MEPRLRAGLLWGLVGALSFLVLAQGYEVLARPGIGLAPKVGVALVVGAVTTTASYAAERWRAARA